MKIGVGIGLPLLLATVTALVGLVLAVLGLKKRKKTLQRKIE